MHPVLFNIFSFPIHSYGFMLALSFLFGIWLSSRRAKARGLNPEVIADVGFWVILSAIAGSRLYYVLLHFEEFRGNLLSIINPFQGGSVGIGGLVMYGGFIGAIIAGVIYFNVKKLPFLPYANAIAPSVGFGIMLTRIGCFLNGCCYGGAASGASGVSFPLTSPAGAYQYHIHAAALYPSQLFESFGGLIIGLVVLFMGRSRILSRVEFCAAGLMYTILRFAVDFSRFYGTNERLGSFSHNQIVCMVLFIIFGGLILKSMLFNEDTQATSKPDTKSQATNEPVVASVDQK